MNIFFKSLCFLLITCNTLIAQQPKLVVGIVVDQMRYDYIHKYWSKYGDNGFKRLIKEGYSCSNTHYNYIPTFTAPGHASIYSGTTPEIHGIISNDWYDKDLKKYIYCTTDTTVMSVGGDIIAGKMSPRNLLSSTITDELRISSLNESKVIGLALKDRSSILPAGHAANGAYWFDGKSGNFITSSFYMDNLPDWVQQFNKKEMAKAYLSKNWETLLPLSSYTESLEDNNKYESLFKGEKTPTFPHDLAGLQKDNGGLGLIRFTPFGNSFTKDFAIAAIEGENLGKGTATDFLCVSFSSTDYVGHQYGTNAIETEDTYLRLDKDLADLLSYLDKNFGKNNCLIFLTADHGAVPVPQFLMDNKIPGGYLDEDSLQNFLSKQLEKKYGNEKWILALGNDQVFLNETLIMEKKLEIERIENDIKYYLLNYKGVKSAYTKTSLTNPSNDYLLQLTANGFSARRSGNVAYITEPGWLEYKQTGTSHGTAYTYDTHVPLMWWGMVKKGETNSRFTITQIAPTIAKLLRIEKPNGCVSEAINEVK